MTSPRCVYRGDVTLTVTVRLANQDDIDPETSERAARVVVDNMMAK